MLAEALSDSARYAFSGSSERCLVFMPDDLWPVNVDEWEMIGAFNKLLVNANEAMPAGGTIEITTQNIVVGDQHDLPLQPGKYVEISIKDQGTGIPQKYLDKIFHPYFTTRRTSEGMGLAKVYSTIKGYGGHIAAESRMGVGTTFRIYLPAAY